MTNVAKRARRLLAGMHTVATDQRIYPGYISFEEGLRPAWWRDEIAPENWGKVLGVHEYGAGTRAGAIVITEIGMAVLGEGSDITWVPYTEVAGWDELSKEPVSMSLHVRTKSGQRVELPFPRVGEAFGFVQFLSRAIWEHDQERKRSGGD